MTNINSKIVCLELSQIPLSFSVFIDKIFWPGARLKPFGMFWYIYWLVIYAKKIDFLHDITPVRKKREIEKVT